jgi:hypothetical protein
MDQNIIHNINYQELAQEVSRKKQEMPQATHKEIVSTIIAQKREQLVSASTEGGGQATSLQQVKQDDNNSSASVLPNYLQKESSEIKNEVESLIELTLKEGLEKGIAYAVKKEKDPFILDAYHDALSDVLLEELQKRNLLK